MTSRPLTSASDAAPAAEPHHLSQTVRKVRTYLTLADLEAFVTAAKLAGIASTAGVFNGDIRIDELTVDESPE